MNRWWLSVLRLCLSCLLQGHRERKRTEEDGGNERRRRGLLAEEGQKAASLLLFLIPTFPRGYHGFPLTLPVIPFHPIPSPSCRHITPIRTGYSSYYRENTGSTALVTAALDTARLSLIVHGTVLSNRSVHTLGAISWPFSLVHGSERNVWFVALGASVSARVEKFYERKEREREGDQKRKEVRRQE